MSFLELPIHSDLQKAIEAMAFEKPTPIQSKAVPAALEGRDVLGSAQTGSGKTVAFTLPLMQKLLENRPKDKGMVRAVVLTPTRELAAQVEATVKDCARFTKLKAVLVIGGESMHKQTQALQQGADIVIATPGRLLDHLRNTRGFRLDSVEILVLDEADRMLDMGFLPDVSKILERLPKKRQNLMFSATVPKEIEGIVKRFMVDPVRIQIDPPRKPAEGIRQKIYPITQGQKYDLLYALLTHLEPGSSLVFTATKKRADMVASFLCNRKLEAAAMHADLSQSKRTKTLDDFRSQTTKVLVATDIAARGIDIRHVTHVFNFDVPLYAEDYLHRIGRTARAFTIGDAVTLMAPDEKGPMTSIESFVGSEIERCALDGFEYDVPPQLRVFKRPVSSRFGGGRRRAVRRGRRGIL